MITASDIFFATRLPRISLPPHKRRRVVPKLFSDGVSRFELAQVFGVSQDTISADIRGATQ